MMNDTGAPDRWAEATWYRYAVRVVFELFLLCFCHVMLCWYV